MKEFMLTTIDNPYDPFTQFSDWYKFDTLNGYNSSELLDRLTFTSDSNPEFITQSQINQAIDQVLEINPNGMYTKVARE